MKLKIKAVVAGTAAALAMAGAVLLVPGFGDSGRAQAQAQGQNAASAAPSVPQRIETTVYDSWTVTCRDLADKKNDCTAALRVTNGDEGAVVLIWVVGTDPAGKLTSVVQMPTGVRIEPGVVLKIGNAAARKLTYASCSPQFCEAVLPADPGFVKDLSAGAEAVATITLVDGRTADFKFPLTGSAAALKQLTAR